MHIWGSVALLKRLQERLCTCIKAIIGISNPFMRIILAAPTNQLEPQPQVEGSISWSIKSYKV